MGDGLVSEESVGRDDGSRLCEGRAAFAASGSGSAGDAEAAMRAFGS